MNDQGDGFEAALALFRAGAPARSEAVLRSLPDAALGSARGAHLMALVLGAQSRGAEALEWIERAIAAAGPLPALRETRARVLHDLGRDAEAGELLRELLESGAAGSDLQGLLARVLAMLGDREGALQAAQAAGGDRARLDSRIGLELQLRGRSAEALEWYGSALARRPSDAAAHNNLGDALRALGRHEEAIAHYAAAVREEPRSPDLLANLALGLAQAGRVEEAIDRYRALLAMRPDDADAHGNLAYLLLERDDTGQALAHARRSVSLQPSNALGLTNLGLALHKSGLLDEAMAAYREALARAPEDEKAARNLAYLRLDRGDVEGAIADYRAILVAHPSPAARYDLGLACLADARFEEGWRHCEGRLDATPEAVSHRPAAIAPLAAGERLEEHRTALWLEQGIGDQILFSTLVPELEARGAPFVLQADGRLLAAFRRSHPAWTVAAPAQSAHAFAQCDRQLPLGSLAARLRPTAASFAAQPRCLLRADAQRAAAYRDRLGRPGRALLGISWRSFQRRDRRHVQARKSAPLAAFAALAADTGIDLLDLQYGDTALERSAFESSGGALLRLEELDLFADLDGVMAAIEACDGVITTSNVTAHLAGAIGKRTALVFVGRHPPFHYWAPDPQGRSRWYPSVRILRSDSAEDWPALLQRAAALVIAGD